MDLSPINRFPCRLPGLRAGVAALFLAGAAFQAQAAPFSSVYVFGDSLSDSGNNAVVLSSQSGHFDPTPTPIPSNGFIPEIPYQSGVYSNGPVWAQDFAGHYGLAAAPSLLGGTNYAYGGATTGPANPEAFPVSMLDQVNMFLGRPGGAGTAPSDALYVLAGGGNNARAAVDAVGSGADPISTIAATTAGYVTDTLTMVAELLQGGADDIIVWTVPNAALAPAIRELGPAAQAFTTVLAGTMNVALRATLRPIDDIRIFDLDALLKSVVDNPGQYGFDDVEHACAFDILNCDPSRYLFWDGVHPTTAGHALIAQQMIALVGDAAQVSEPGSLALIALAFGPALLIVRRRATRP